MFCQICAKYLISMTSLDFVDKPVSHYVPITLSTCTIHVVLKSVKNQFRVSCVNNMSTGVINLSDTYVHTDLQNQRISEKTQTTTCTSPGGQKSRSKVRRKPSTSSSGARRDVGLP